MEFQLKSELTALGPESPDKHPSLPDSNLVQRLPLRQGRFQLQWLETPYETQQLAFQSPWGFDNLNLGLLNGAALL